MLERLSNLRRADHVDRASYITHNQHVWRPNRNWTIKDIDTSELSYEAQEYLPYGFAGAQKFHKHNSMYIMNVRKNPMIFEPHRNLITNDVDVPMSKTYWSSGAAYDYFIDSYHKRIKQQKKASSKVRWSQEIFVGYGGAQSGLNSVPNIHQVSFIALLDTVALVHNFPAHWATAQMSYKKKKYSYMKMWQTVGHHMAVRLPEIIFAPPESLFYIMSVKDVEEIKKFLRGLA